jgi:hypothetical protein
VHTSTWQHLINKKKSFNLNDPSAHSPVELWKSSSFPDDVLSLEDFRRTFLSGGAINPPDRPNFLHQNAKYEDEDLFGQVKWFFKLIRRLMKLQLHSFRNRRKFFFYYPDKSRKKFRRISLFDNYLMDLSIRVSYYLSVLSDQRECKDKFTVLEIGGGFGALSTIYCLKSPHSTYYLVDLPENLLISYINLREAGIPVTTIENLPSDFSGVVLLTGNEIAKVHNCDFVINTMSFQHMNKVNIEYYFSNIFRIQPRKIYLVNRSVKRDLTDISIFDYPNDPRYRLVRENSIFTDEHIEQEWELRTKGV